MLQLQHHQQGGWEVGPHFSTSRSGNPLMACLNNWRQPIDRMFKQLVNEKSRTWIFFISLVAWVQWPQSDLLLVFFLSFMCHLLNSTFHDKNFNFFFEILLSNNSSKIPTFQIHSFYLFYSFIYFYLFIYYFLRIYIYIYIYTRTIFKIIS